MRYAILTAVVALGAGCVPVTEPVGDIDKAEPDAALLGAWSERAEGDTTDLVVDAPAVKGNPKGLMRASSEGKTDAESVLWFTSAAVGKGRYASVILAATGGALSPAFATAGEFARWHKEKDKRYFVFRYALDGDKLTVDGGDRKAFDKVMAGAKVGTRGESGSYLTPAGWLAEYLGKNDPATIFDGSNARTYHRLKKK